jgi:hypothetical protein
VGVSGIGHGGDHGPTVLADADELAAAAAQDTESELVGVSGAWPSPDLAAACRLRPSSDLKTFHLKLSHRILRHIHRVLNVDEKN